MSGPDEEAVSGLGQPKQAPRESRELSAGEVKALEDRLRREEERRARELADSIRSESGIKLPSFLFSATFIMAAVSLAGVFLLFILTQTLSFFESLSRAPAPAAYLGYGAVALLLLVMLLTMLRLAWLYLRLGKNRQVSLKVIGALESRRELRELSRQELREARARLMRYLEGFRLEGDRAGSELAALGFLEEEVEALKNHKQRLLDENLSPSSEEWIRDFRQGFQAALDKAGSRRIKTFALRVGLKTAIIPISLVDAVIVVYSSFMMIGDLCRIYNLRLGGLSTAVILARAFVHAYLAAEIEEMSEKVFDSIMDSEGLVSQFAGAIAPKLVEGKANAFLIWRLGRAASALLRPVSPEESGR